MVGSELVWGNYITGSIHGYKFHDLNANSQLDEGEPALADIKFDLYRWVSSTTIDPPSADPFVVHDWEYVKSETSDSHGRFWFTDLDPGEYVVREDLAGTEYIQSTGQAKGSPDTNYAGGGVLPSALGEDPNATSTGTFLVQSGVEYVHEENGHVMYMDLNGDGNIDAGERAAAEQLVALKTPVIDTAALTYGNYLLGSFHGYKFEDLDNDGFDANDPGMEGITFVLLDGSGNVLDTQVTDADGAFWFTGLVPGASYTVSEVDLAGQDILGDGVSDIDQGLRNASTDAGDDYTVNLLSGQEYAWEAGAAMLPAGSAKTEVVVGSELVWGNYITGSIHGYKFHDLDGSGTQDPGEPDQADIKFDLYRWVSTETIDPPSADPFVVHDWEYLRSETSDSHGRFWFTDLDPGQYVVREDLSGTEWTQSTGQAQGSPDTNYAGGGVLPGALGEDPNAAATGTFAVQSRQEYVHEAGGHIMYMDLNNDGNVDAAERAAAEQLVALKTPVIDAAALTYGNYVAGSIHGYKFEDIDNDGFDESDPAMAGIAFELLDASGNRVSLIDTDSSGGFWFTGLRPGTYTVRELDPADPDQDILDDGVSDYDQGLRRSSGDDFTVTIVSGQEYVPIDGFADAPRGIAPQRSRGRQRAGLGELHHRFHPRLQVPRLQPRWDLAA